MEAHRHVTNPDSPDLRRWRRHLLWRIHRRYQTVTQTIELCGRQYLFTRIADPDRVLDQVAEEEDRQDKLAGKRRPGNTLHLPYWAELWDSALGMGQFLIQHSLATRNSQLATSSTLDLGCGMGLAGTVAASQGHRVLFADLEAPALLFARLNSLSDAARVRTRRLNWQTDRLAEQFELILGADILYERSQWEYLDRFWRAHLRPGGSILLGEPGRQTGDLFITWAQSAGWNLIQHEEPVTTRPRPIRLFQLTLPA